MIILCFNSQLCLEFDSSFSYLSFRFSILPIYNSLPNSCIKKIKFEKLENQ